MINVIKVDDFEKFTAKLEEIATAIQNMPTPSGNYTFEKIGEYNNGCEFQTAIQTTKPFSDYDAITLYIATRDDIASNITQLIPVTIPVAGIGEGYGNGNYLPLYGQRYIYVWIENGELYSNGRSDNEGVGYYPRIYKIYGIKY